MMKKDLYGEASEEVFLFLGMGRTTLTKNLIFADNSSANFSWQVGNRYEIRSEKFHFLKSF